MTDSEQRRNNYVLYVRASSHYVGRRRSRLHLRIYIVSV